MSLFVCDAENGIRVNIIKQGYMFTASTKIHDAIYVSDVVTVPEFYNVKFAEMHNLFPPTIDVADEITLRYDITFLQLQLIFVMKKKEYPMKKIMDHYLH